MKGSLRRIGLDSGALVVAFAILLVLSTATIVSQRRSAKAFGRVTHVSQILLSSEALLGSLRDAETGQRGFLLTGHENYLEPYHAASARIDGALARVRDLVAGDPAQLERVDRLETLSRQKLDELRETIELKRLRGGDAALEVVLSHRGKRSMDEARVVVSEIESAERIRLREQQAIVAGSARTTSILATLGTGSIIVLTLLAIRNLRRENARKLRMEEEKRRLEQELRQSKRMEALGVLSGAVAHDFNNLLAGIQGAAEVLAHRVGEEKKARADLDIIFETCARAGKLVERILSFSRRDDVVLRPLSFHREIELAIALIRASLPDDVTIRKQLDPACGFVLGDPTRIQQIVLNLCTNAAQAMADGGGVVTIGLDRVVLGHDAPELLGIDREPGSYGRLRVNDTGIGMDEETRSRMFDPFFTTKAVGAGTGLGLAVVHASVAEHEGFISVASEPGRGTAFDVYLPLSDQQPAEDRDAPSESELGRLRVLFVDDEKNVVRNSKLLLERVGCDVEAHQDGEAALEAFRSRPHGFDVVVTDQTMPSMTGTELASEILRIRSDVPVILASGYREAAPEAAQVGFRGFLAKPYTAEELFEAIAESGATTTA